MKRTDRKYEALYRKIAGTYGGLQPFAEDAGLSISALSQKLNGGVKIDTVEMFEWCRLLNVSPIEIPMLFDVSGNMRKVMSA